MRKAPAPPFQGAATCDMASRDATAAPHASELHQPLSKPIFPRTRMVSQNLKQGAKTAALAGLYAAGILLRRVMQKSAGAALILAYHRVAPASVLRRETVMPGMYVSDDTLRLHLRWLSTHYRMVTVDQLLSHMESDANWDPPLCAVTFDDGWYDNYQYALPVLRETGVPATVFPIGARVGISSPSGWDLCFEIVKHEDGPRLSTRRTDLDALFGRPFVDPITKTCAITQYMRDLPANEYDDVCERLTDYYVNNMDTVAIDAKYRTLSWTDMHAMAASGVEFGYHTLHHYMLTRVAEMNLYQELTLPPEAAANGLELKKVLCYPDGKYDDRVIRIASELGYRGAVTLEPKFNHKSSHPYKLHRYNVHEGGANTLQSLLWTLGYF